MVNEKLVYNPNAQSLPTDSTAIVNKLDNGALAVKGKNKSQKKRRLAVAKNVITELNKIAEAEGAVEAPMDKGESMVKAEVVKEKVKPKKERQATTLQYPMDARINGYNFMRFSNDLLADLGWHVDMALKVDKNADGSITLRKA